jgi:hypothetical protein
MGTRIAVDVEVSAKAQFKMTREVVPMTNIWKAISRVMAIIAIYALGLGIKTTSAVPLCL